MGIVHKLIPQIKDFILEQKKANSKISCRNLSGLIDDKFQIRVSKSSINAIFKESGLSMPVGRSSEAKRKLRIEAPALLLSAPTPESVIEEPVIPAPEPVIEKPVEPSPEQIIKQPTEPIPEPIIEKPAEPIPEPIIDKPSESIPEPIIDKPSEPAPEPIPEPVTKKVIKEFEKIELTEAQTNGVIILKAADYLINGNYDAAEIIKKRLNRSGGNLPAQTEAFTFAQLPNLLPANLEPITGIRMSAEDLENYAQEINSVKTLTLDISRVIANCLEEVRCIKVILSDGNTFYLDAQLHSIWSTPHIPYDFSTTTSEIKRAVNDYFFEGVALSIFMAPGYDTPSKDLFNFIAGMDCVNKKITRLTICGNRFEDMDTIAIETPKKYNYIFGAWPWQFVGARKVNKIGEFKPYRSEILKKDVFCAQLDIDFIHPETKESVNLKGCSLKMSAGEKTRLIILSNLSGEKAAPAVLCEAYLSRWPNLEEAYQDYSRKIELFTYTAESRAFFNPEYFGLESVPTLKDAKTIANNYLLTLDSFLKWHLLPQGYEKQDFTVTKTRFYDLKVGLKKEISYVAVNFQIPQGYSYLNDLQYLCRRLNERNIRLSDGLRLWFKA
ncbi:MAG: procyclic acidic repetitive family protein [Candidatus Omnitrophica bacterium]|nr:procyclic acidic repetitive family protein [Candidatus Omnitrophota bacterium]